MMMMIMMMMIIIIIIIIHELNFTVDTLNTALRKICGGVSGSNRREEKTE